MTVVKRCMATQRAMMGARRGLVQMTQDTLWSIHPIAHMFTAMLLSSINPWYSVAECS